MSTWVRNAGRCGAVLAVASAITGGHSDEARARTTSDVNGDGLADVVLSHPVASADPTIGTRSHAVAIVFGSREPASLNRGALAPGSGFTIRTAYNVYGYRTVGDVDDDGMTDVLVQTGPNPGAAPGSSGRFLVFGRRETADLDLDRRSPGIQRVSRLLLGGIGDVTGDGVDDLIFSGRRGTRSFTVRYGRRGSRRVTPPSSRNPRRDALVIRLSVEGGYVAFAPAGDANADGVNDVAIKLDAYYDCGEVGPCGGPAFVIFGRRKPATVEITTARRRGFVVRTVGSRRPAGYAVDAMLAGPFGSPGDFDGDGRDDLFAPAPLGQDAMIIRGRPTPRLPPSSPPGRGDVTRITGSPYSGEFGLPLGDVNGDGWGDVLVTVTPYPSVTLAVVFGRHRRAAINRQRLGSGGRLITVPSGSLSQLTGHPLGDVNGDGLSDFAVTTMEYFGGLERTYVVLGTRSAAPTRLDALGANGFVIE